MIKNELFDFWHSKLPRLVVSELAINFVMVDGLVDHYVASSSQDMAPSADTRSGSN